MAKKPCPLPSRKTVNHNWFNNENYELHLLEEQNDKTDISNEFLSDLNEKVENTNDLIQDLIDCSCTSSGTNTPTFLRINDEQIDTISNVISVSFYNKGDDVLINGTVLKDKEGIIFEAEPNNVLTSITYDTTGGVDIDLLIIYIV